MEFVTAPVDHNIFPVLQEAFKVTGIPLQTVELLPVPSVIVGAEGVTTVAVTNERPDATVSQPTAFLQPT